MLMLNLLPHSAAVSIMLRAESQLEQEIKMTIDSSEIYIYDRTFENKL